MNKKPSVDCLLVTGMYRSGLSALSECLQLLGVKFGKSTSYEGTPAATDQTAANDVTQIHDMLFKDLGCSWDMIGSFPMGWLDSEAAKTARKRIRDLIESRYPKKGLWAIVDPRLCRLMPLWIGILDEQRINPGILLMVRHPLEVAQSIQTDSKIDIQQSLLLWLALNKEALDCCRNRPYQITSYDQLVADPVMILNRIESQFQMSFSIPLREKIYDIMDAVRPDLKNHHLSESHESSRNGKASSAFALFYDRITRHSSTYRWTENQSVPLNDMNVSPHDNQRNNVYPELAFDPVRDIIDHQLHHHLLDLIGNLEREKKDQASQKERLILNDSHTDEALFACVYIPPFEDESPTATESILLKNGEWQQVRFPISHPERLKTAGLGFSPLNTRGVVSISTMSLVNIATGKACRQVVAPDALQSVELKGVLQLPTKDALMLVTLTDQALLTLPILSDVPDVPMEFRVWIKVETRERIFAENIVKYETAFRRQIEETSQNCNVLQKRIFELEEALNQSHSIQKTLRKVVYETSLHLYDRQESESRPVSKDFLNNEKVYFDRSIIAYDDQWQYPGITEKHAFLKAKELLPVSDDIVYFGFPWATLIDIFQTKVEDKNKLLDKLKLFQPILKNFKYIVTTCQHIHLIKYKDVFKNAGVTHIFWPHTTKGLDTLPGSDQIKVFPFPLYPVNVQENMNGSGFEEKRYLFSFVGAIDKPWYLTNTRSLIIDQLSNTDRGKIISRETWHFDKAVYDHQIRGKNVKGELIDSRTTREYLEILAQSIFSLCPSGSGSNSIRLWEAIGSGSIPVILSDTYQHPGPPSLWEGAVFWCKENLDDISALPKFLSEMAADKEIMNYKLNALKHLWGIYGPDFFIYDILNLFKYH